MSQSIKRERKEKSVYLNVAFDDFGIVEKSHDALALGVDVAFAAEFQHRLLLLL